MTVREYIGARYVPLFMGDWDVNADYEPLSIVQYQGNSYTSRQAVPHGVEITNTAYWAVTGNYNAQVEAYRQEVRAMETSITAIDNALPIGDYSANATVTDAIRAVEDAANSAIQDLDTSISNKLAEKAFAFETVADMKAAENLFAGAICHTNGFEFSGDGNGAWYEITNSGTPDELNVIACGSLFANKVPYLYITPDMYVGSNDSEKLQACFDDAGINGYTILIDRTYEITTPIVIKHDSDARNTDNQRLIVKVLGYGKQSRFKINSTGFVGESMANHCGGVLFSNVEFFGASHETSVVFNMNDLIRLYVNDCTFDHCQHAFFCTVNYMQDLHVIQSEFTDIVVPVYCNATSFALSFVQCMFEAPRYGDTAFVIGTPSAAQDSHNVSIIQCVFEGYARNGIECNSRNMGFELTSCYFESNGTYDVLFTNTGGSAIINGCYFNGGNDKSAIKLPDSAGGRLPRISARGNYVGAGYFLDDSSAVVCFVDIELVGTNTFKADKAININRGSEKYETRLETINFGTTLADTGLTIEIPIYSYYDIRVTLRNYNTRPNKLVISSIGNETGIVRQCYGYAEKDDNVYDVMTSINGYTTEALTLHIYGAYDAAGSNTVEIASKIGRRYAP